MSLILQVSLFNFIHTYRIKYENTIKKKKIKTKEYICFANSPETRPALKKEELPHSPNKQGRWDPELVEAVPSPLVPIQLVGVPVTVTPGPPWLKER